MTVQSVLQLNDGSSCNDGEDGLSFLAAAVAFLPALHHIQQEKKKKDKICSGTYYSCLGHSTQSSSSFKLCVESKFRDI